ncbi:hypothetical protein QYE76_053707 [Lolium multiflorum]|uniref:Integrase catalytic domain-containing protein n=1 Tax=Lolium multiflorum TaxID=4521 RepID=A0AAD8SW99_LOLMU|nr:hypothetical protein QYE76_053707 [Lolium multiflorum]
MFINEDNEYETGDDVDPNAPDDDDYDTDGEDAYPSDARTIVVSQRALNVLPSASTQRCNLFQTKALVGPDKACKVIIDGGSCRNLASKELCTKLKLKKHPYYIQWLSDNGEMKVNHMVRVEFAIGPNSATCFRRRYPQDYHHCEESHAGGLMGHFGREKTLLMLADHFYWPKMRRDVDRYVRRCITCNKSKSKLKPHVYELLLEDALEKAGDEAAFQTTCHPQTDGQTEVVNRTLSQLLRFMIKKNLKEWEECLPHVEFAYNRAVHSTTELCPFEVVYGFKPITPLDLLPLHIHERVNMEASKRADFVKKIHVKTKELIEKKGKSNATRMNKKRKEMLFKPDLGTSGSTPFEGGDDEDIPTSLLPPSLPIEDEPAVKLKSNEVRIGPMTRARAKLLKQHVNLYQEETSIARVGEEQLDVKLDMELDMELDMKISHGRAREEREACARGDEEIQAGPPGRPAPTPAARPWPGRVANRPPTGGAPRTGETGNLADFRLPPG